MYVYLHTEHVNLPWKHHTRLVMPSDPMRIHASRDLSLENEKRKDHPLHQSSYLIPSSERKWKIARSENAKDCKANIWNMFKKTNSIYSIYIVINSFDDCWQLRWGVEANSHDLWAIRRMCNARAIDRSLCPCHSRFAMSRHASEYSWAS